MTRKESGVGKKISAVIITRDSAKFIADSIKTLQWCDEVVVIDDSSVDGTIKVAKKLGAKVYSREMKGDFAAQRNYAYVVAKNEWLFFIDDDELSTLELQKEMESKISDPKNKKIALYYMRRHDFFLGKPLRHGPAGDAFFPRLVRKSKSHWTDRIFEQLHVRGEKAYLEQRMLHKRQETVTDLVVKANYYSDLEADMMFEKGVKPKISEIVFDPISRFFKYYVRQKAFLDGMPGFIFVILGSVLVRWLGQVKLWAKWNSEISHD